MCRGTEFEFWGLDTEGSFAHRPQPGTGRRKVIGGGGAEVLGGSEGPGHGGTYD